MEGRAGGLRLSTGAPDVRYVAWQNSQDPQFIYWDRAVVKGRSIIGGQEVPQSGLAGINDIKEIKNEKNGALRRQAGRRWQIVRSESLGEGILKRGPHMAFAKRGRQAGPRTEGKPKC